ncbi:uncharacterized protein LOC126326556 [Schistocerca gregaria]|uniref:uncharacterized protein LOC126326556 n=1 Tax=Schistocerca gregaria TaxID=7010 RepID=UPI00211DBB2F|nr:uncharacterized protein LOC126326556 [Schistocerca gregaria]
MSGTFERIVILLLLATQLVLGELQTRTALPDEDRLFYQRNSFRKPFYSSPSFWILGGNAIVQIGGIFLAPNAQNEGWIWNSVPVLAPNWLALLDISIDTSVSAGSEFVFWYISNPQVQFGMGGSQNVWKGLGIFMNPCEGQHTLCIRASVNKEDSMYQEFGSSESVGFCKLSASDGGLRFRVSYAGNRLLVDYMQEGTALWNACLNHATELDSGMHLALSARSGVEGGGYYVKSIEVQKIQIGDENNSDSTAQMATNREYRSTEMSMAEEDDAPINTTTFRRAGSNTHSSPSLVPNLTEITSYFEKVYQGIFGIDNGLNKVMSKLMNHSSSFELFAQEVYQHGGTIKENIQRIHTTTMSIINGMAANMERVSNAHEQLRFELKTEISAIVMSANQMSEKLDKLSKHNAHGRITSMLLYVIVLQSVFIFVLIWMTQMRPGKVKCV